ncbi:MAG: hypothetical protein ACTHJ6_06090 [Oryzihumus sp.]
MGAVVALGSLSRMGGFALAGARVVAADTPDEVESAWAGLGPDVAVVILTPEAAQVLGARVTSPPRPGSPLCVVMPAGPQEPR